MWALKSYVLCLMLVPGVVVVRSFVSNREGKTPIEGIRLVDGFAVRLVPFGEVVTIGAMTIKFSNCVTRKRTMLAGEAKMKPRC